VVEEVDWSGFLADNANAENPVPIHKSPCMKNAIGAGEESVNTSLVNCMYSSRI
jgi:hypothetical protein